MSIESRFRALKYSSFMNMLSNNEAKVKLYINSNDNIENAIKSQQIIKSKQIHDHVYFTNFKYYSHPIFISGRYEYWFEIGKHEIMISDLSDDYKKRLPPELVASCNCNDFKLLKNVNIPCKHIYKSLFAFKDNKFINIQQKCYSNKYLLMRRNKIYVPHHQASKRSN
ncbi:MAG: SWIM zinc finger family protein [Methanosarcinales archaeon]